MKHRTVLWLVLAVALASAPAGAEEAELRRFEVGTQFTALDLRNSIGEKPAGIGGRFGYNLNPFMTLETELNYFPQNPDGNFGETQGLFGVKVGYRFGNLGVFAKARPGFVRFGGSFYRRRNPGDLTHPAIDLGGVVELYGKQQHLGLRLDWGDTIISFGNGPINTGALRPYAGGIAHNFQVSIGVVFRF